VMNCPQRIAHGQPVKASQRRLFMSYSPSSHASSIAFNGSGSAKR
jgi:hypothetical protein